VLDDSGRHQHPTVKKWLAARPRYPVHFTPTSSSWLNPIERWFAEITRKRIRRGTFRSVGDLTRAIQESIQRSNRKRQPFQWVASARKIIRKVNKYKETLETAD
jgi:transposase